MGRHRLAHDQPPRVADLAATRVPPDLLPPVPRDPWSGRLRTEQRPPRRGTRAHRKRAMRDVHLRCAPVPRVPLHSGSRLPVVTVPDDAVLLVAPPPLDPIADVDAAVAEALRYPLAGEPLRAVAPAGGRATVVVQPPELPLPTAQDDPRRDALSAVLDELARPGSRASGSRCSSQAVSRGERGATSSKASCVPTGRAPSGADRRPRLRGRRPAAASRRGPRTRIHPGARRHRPRRDGRRSRDRAPRRRERAGRRDVPRGRSAPLARCRCSRPRARPGSNSAPRSRRSSGAASRSSGSLSCSTVHA